MRNFIFISFVCYIMLYGCKSSTSKETIHFKPLEAARFNFSADSSFASPKGKVWEERKRVHDSCMGESFEANAVFLKTKDTFRLGCIVNMQTMKIVKNFDVRDLPPGAFSSAASFMTKPCYEKMKLGISSSAFLNHNASLIVAGADQHLNTELSDIFNNSSLTEVEAGSWLNVELTDVFSKILDTTSNAGMLEYKKFLLDTSNMVLVRSSSMTDINFYITTQDPLSAQIQQVLSQKPFATIEPTDRKAQLFLLSGNQMQVKFTGYFQVTGQFMSCRLE